MKNLSFIQPGENIIDGDDLKIVTGFTVRELQSRWYSEKGKNILNSWRSSGFNIETIRNLVGKYHGHLDLRGIPLQSETISGQDFSFIDFFGASFAETEFNNVNFSDSWLSETDLTGTCFKWSQMDNALLDNVIFNTETEFHGVDLNKINFTLAAILRDQAIGQQRIAHLKVRSPLLSKLLWVTSDYGRSLTRWLFWVLGIVVMFGFFYWLYPNATNSSGYWDAVYFSFVTFTTLGYGDILPIALLSKCVVVLEVVLGYMMGGLLVAILAKKVIGN